MTDKVIHPRSSRRIRSTLMVSAMLLGVAACGSDEESSDETSAVTAAPTTAAAAAPTTAAAAETTAAAAETTAAATETTAGGGAASGTPVEVTETEFKIELSTTTFAPGDYTFDITNAGEFKHNIVVEDASGEEQKSDTFEGGQAGQLAVTLAAGTYEVYCAVPTHKDKGMTLMVTVA